MHSVLLWGFSCVPLPRTLISGRGQDSPLFPLFRAIRRYRLGLCRAPHLAVPLGAKAILSSKRSKNARAKRVVIVGLDGQDPELTEKWMNEGLLPNFPPAATSAPSRGSPPRFRQSRPCPGLLSRLDAIRASIDLRFPCCLTGNRSCPNEFRRT